MKNLLTTSVESKSQIYMDLFIVYRLNNYDSAKYFAEQALESALLERDSLMFVRAEYALGYLYRTNGFFIRSIDHYLKALKTAKNNGFAGRVKNTLNGLALAYYYDGRYDKSLEYHFESLKLREDDNDLEEIAIASNNIGLVYFQINDFDKALVYFKRTLEIERDIQLDGIVATYNNMGLAHGGLSEFEESLSNFTKAIEECESGCDDAYLVEAYNGAGSAHYGMGNSAKAEEYFSKALKVALKSNIETKIIIIYHNWAKLLLEGGNVDQAKIYLDSSQNLAEKLSYRKWESQNFQLYAKIFSAQKMFEKAYEYQKQYDSINQTILNETIARNMLDIQVDYQEKENLEKIASQDQEISRRNTLLYLSVVIIILISIILFILYRINQLRRKTNRELAEAKRIIEQQNNVLEEKVRERTKELKEANAALMKSNTDLDNFIYKTSHDIRGPLATLQGMCNVALIDIQEQKSRDYFDKIGKT
ncbi:MAG: tetratricopeptide repeat protein, partial [Bacteroidota bacterium]